MEGYQGKLTKKQTKEHKKRCVFLSLSTKDFINNKLKSKFNQSASIAQPLIKLISKFEDQNLKREHITKLINFKSFTFIKKTNLYQSYYREYFQMKTKSTEIKQHKKSAGAKKVKDSRDVEEIDLDDDEDYDSEVESKMSDFIADEDEVVEELNKEKRRKKRELRKELQKNRAAAHDSDGSQLDDEDYELIKENKGGRRKLKKVRDIEEVSEDTPRKAKVDIIEDEQIESKVIKAERNDAFVKKQIFADKRDDRTTADDDKMVVDSTQALKDKFLTEEIDDLFGTAQDLKIIEEDVPERLQIKLKGRFAPSDEELEAESEWIFNILKDQFEHATDQSFFNKIQEIKKKISKALRLFRSEKCDIPYITKYRQSELIPELSSKDVYRIFDLDIEYGKYQVQKKQCEEFFSKISEFCAEDKQKVMEYYKNQIFYSKNSRDLNDFSPLINFYKSYYQKELELIVSSAGKKVPVQKKDLVYNARQHRLDEFSSKCMLTPIQLQENMNEDKQMHIPPNPSSIGPTDMAKEYTWITDQNPLTVIKEMCSYTATELASEPDIRRGLKQHIYENGWIRTEPTWKGKKELDVFHPCYRVKHVNKRLIDLADNDLFLEILQNESLGLITYEITIEDNCQNEKIGNRFFEKMFNNYKFPDDQSKWRFLRLEIFEIISSNSKDRTQKSFLQSIQEEVKNELKEDAEKFVLYQCAEKYRSLLEMGYFKSSEQTDNKVHSKSTSDDLIEQRERLNVMGAIMHPIDARNYLTTIAVVNQFGELVAHKDFLHILPPKKKVLRDGQADVVRPGEEEEKKKHEEDKEAFQEILKQNHVDLIVVAADCLEARRLKKALSEFANLNSLKDQIQDEDEARDAPNKKEAFVTWGRPEVPKLFASSHYSQKLLKNHPFVLKKAICLARFEQDPMNEILNLWSPIMSENQALQLNLHPLQKFVNQARLVDVLEEQNIKTVNSVGIDINLLVDHEHMHNQLQFLSGLGPRKAQRYIQKLKSLGKPIYTRQEIIEKKILQKFCFVSSFAMTKVYVPEDKRPDKDFVYNILDQTRIHYRNYDSVYKIATDCVYDANSGEVDKLKQHQAVIEVIKNPKKLQELAHTEYKEQLRKLDNVGMTYIYDQIVKELMHPFKDPRESKEVIRHMMDQKFTSKELFYYLIDESERTFKQGIIVSASVLRVYDANGDKPARILCRLENGLDANINEQDADFFNQGEGRLSAQIENGSIITGRIASIKFGEKTVLDDNFSVILKCKQSDLRSHKQYVDKIDGVEYPEEDFININFKQQEDQKQDQKKTQINKRKIQHQRFQNISSVQALAFLQKEDNGEFYFRPSSKGNDHLTLTWKFFETNIVHIDIKEEDKAIGANIGSKLKIGEETYENLQEIVERYINPCNRTLREVIQHPKFIKCTNMDEIGKAVEAEKQEDGSRIPYRFTVLDKYPQYVVLAYIPSKVLVKEFIKIKPRGYFFHHQYHYPFVNMINWFKQNFRSKDYQRYIRKTGSPQLAGVKLPSSAAAAPVNPSNVPMEVDQDNNASHGGWGKDADVGSKPKAGGYGRGIRRESSPPREGGWGASGTQQSSNVKDERERGWGDNAGGGNDWGNDQNSMGSPDPVYGAGRGRGRGRGGRDGGDRDRDGGQPKGSGGCYKCGQDGHFARECPSAGDDGRGSKGYGRGARGGRDGGAGDRGPRTCYNCSGEGHMSRECPEPKKERHGGDGGGYKRQRREDDHDNDRYAGGRGDESGWNANKASGGWGANQGGSQGGENNWGSGGANKSSQNEGGWNAQSHSQKQASQGQASQGGNEGGWGNDNRQSQNTGGGW